MDVKRIAKASIRAAVGAAVGGSLLIGSCESNALNAAMAGLEAAAAVLDRGDNGTTSISFEDYLRSQLD